MSAVPTLAENRQVPTATARSAADQSNATLLRRMLRLAWTYRRGCLKVLGLQTVLLAGNVGGLGLAGVGIDFIAHRVDATRPAPRWPFGWEPPAAWSPMSVVALLAAGVLAVALARALLLEPAILLLDDPTAAVDPGTEHEILSALDGARAGRTTFLVAHRVSTLRRADRVMVLDAGRIVEFGPPAELARKPGGYYRRVAELQVADAESLRQLART